ncbi:MAG: AAA family ATPase [Caldilineaceae bacterium]
MYIKSVEIRNVRSLRHFAWSLQDQELPGWHVLIGDNGSGKSTILKAISLALVGEKDAQGLREDWSTWLTKEAESGSIGLDLAYDASYDNFSGYGRVGERNNLKLKAVVDIKYTEEPKQPVRLEGKTKSSNPSTNRHVWGTGNGWFSVAYGPFRRFSGGNPDYNRVYYANPKLAAHLSIFGEDVALSEAVAWLQELNYKNLEKQPEGELLEAIRKFVNQEDFLPHRAQLKEISSTGVFFEDANSNIITVDKMSDGYRSILSMTFEIIRQLQAIYQTDELFSPDFTQIKLPGVVLIDEIDAHLHPTWQRRVGYWFRQHFPAMQFIVTTHSPLVCQAAERGSVWKLPRPGTEESSYRVTGQELDRLLYGNILEAYSTQLFGLTDTRSNSAQEKLERLAQLNVKEIFAKLTTAEIEEQTQLRAALPTTANITEGP